ncbi:multiple epidermal growth factor-like domains protein 6 [Limulus polyphemus]|uniref:Multiple epidermal growth factor-like domains protein 6 n=1 Tax=Limulus polyphemus TaxID=6850 RepID=A0ABM1TB03_LIMPO|nr:multiple epidermal growth factor-like domains protein 6 [Limulus polyphemus]
MTSTVIILLVIILTSSYHARCMVTYLASDMPNVCPYRTVELVPVRTPCIKAYTRMVKVWKPNCGYTRNWCVGYEPRTTYYSSYRQEYERRYRTEYKCCDGFKQLNGERGCNYPTFEIIEATKTPYIKLFDVITIEGRQL